VTSETDDTILDLWGVGPNRPPVDTHHPAVITHPVTRLKALNITNSFVTGFAELKKKESGISLFRFTFDLNQQILDNLLQFVEYHINSAADHQVRWKWEKGSVAIWDNRATAHRAIPGKYSQARRGIRTTVFGTKPAFDPRSESRDERARRLIEFENSDSKNKPGGPKGDKIEDPSNALA
jgi:alpha-ketoglutarate-dependent taurine dioxygenase